MDTNFVPSGIVDIDLRNEKKSYRFLQDKYEAETLMQNLREAKYKYAIISTLVGVGSGGWNISLKINHYDLMRFLGIYYPDYNKELERPKNGMWMIDFWEHDLRNVHPCNPRLIKLQTYGLKLSNIDSVRYRCPVCQMHIFKRPEDHEECPVCHWRYDEYQYQYPTEIGTNDISLSEAYINYAKTGKIVSSD